MLVSTVQRSESAICIHISSLSWAAPPPAPSHPSRSPQSMELSSQCCISGSHWLSVLHMEGYICQSQSPNSSQFPFPTPCPSVHSLSLHVCSCSANRFLCAIFLDSICTHEYMIFVFLFVIYFTL